MRSDYQALILSLRSKCQGLGKEVEDYEQTGVEAGNTAL